MNASDVKQAARESGADLVGIAPIARLEHLPPDRNPRPLSPRVRSVVVVGLRILRGSLRGVEEGTNFNSTYRFFGVHTLENDFLARTVNQVAMRLEAGGAEAVPLLPFVKGQDRFVPDYAAYAQAAGLGVMGKGGFFLTPRFGHRQRFGMILTDAELEGDPLCGQRFCKDCRACRDACPLHALSGSDGGAEPYAVALERCRECRNGAWANSQHADPVDRYAAACGRACLVALEGKTESRFAEPFRKRSVWALGAPAGENWQKES